MAEEEPTAKPKPSAVEALSVWVLEDAFPSVSGLLLPSQVKAASDDTLLVLDTNVLLVPYGVGGSKLSAIKTIYQDLLQRNRLFVPARALREFFKNRDSQVAKILQTMRDKSSGTKYVGADIPNFLKDSDEAKAVVAAGKEVEGVQRKYKKAMDALVSRLIGWRGDDPVTMMYRELFQGDAVIEGAGDRVEIAANWSHRWRHQVPPGYKDGGKPDTGIGDYLIWLAILELGKSRQQDVIFVTGEAKPDWIVSAGNEGFFPRPELVDEYRRASNGRNFQIARLNQILREMEAPTEVVDEVREAERTSFTLELGEVWEAKFDYSKNNGILSITAGSTVFTLKFSKASDKAIHIYTTPDVPAIARVKEGGAGQTIAFEDFDYSSHSYTIRTGEVFLARHATGYVLAGRILRIEDDSRGYDSDSVAFVYRISESSERVVLP